MKYLDFEKHIKNELGSSKEPVQMDSLLNSLNLGEKPKRKGFAFWMVLPFLLVTFSALAWKFMDTSSSKNADTYLVEDVFSAKENDKNDYSAIVENKSVETDQASNANFNDNLNVDADESQSTINEHQINDTNQNLTENNRSENTTYINSKNESSVKSKFIDGNQNKKQTNNNTTSNNVGNTLNFNNSYINSKTATNSTNNKVLVTPIADASNRVSRNLLSIEDLNAYSLELNSSKVDDKLFSRMKINCPSFDNARWHMALIPEIGLFVPFKSLESKTFEVSDALTERLDSESTLEGIELGLYGMLVRDNVPFYLKAGISYSRISERMDLKYEFTEQDTTIGIISSTYSANGDTITHIYGDIISETTFKGSNRQHHYVHLFDVPISIGYTTYIAGLDVGIEGGVKINFMTRGTGNLLTSKSGYTNLSLNRLFKNRIGVSYFGGLMIGRNFGQYGDFYLAPRFTYYPNDFTTQNNDISQKYFSVGLSAGVVYKID